MPVPNRRVARLAAPVGGVLLGLLLVPTPAVASAPAAPAAPPAGRGIEPFPVLQPQIRCHPTAKPGTRQLAAYLLRRYPGTRTGGISRACGRGKPSEHKEGRALDWRLRAAVPRERQQAANFLTWLFRPDAAGNPLANARRLGVMYVVWNRQIFGTYTPGWRPYTGSSPHVDHMHISLTWHGAMGVTSFWTGRVAPLFSSPSASQQVLVLPARSSVGVRTPQALLAGATYVIRSSGMYAYGKGLADGECVRPGTGPWQAGDRRTRGLQRLDLRLDGDDLRFSPVMTRVKGMPSVAGCGVGSHTYDAVYTADRTGPAHFTLGDRRPGDNRGQLLIRIVRVA